MKTVGRMTAHTRMRYVDFCGSCGKVIVTFQTPGGRLVRGCDCLSDCAHPHAASFYDMSYAVLGTPVRSSVARSGDRNG